MHVMNTYSVFNQKYIFILFFYASKKSRNHKIIYPIPNLIRIWHLSWTFKFAVASQDVSVWIVQWIQNLFEAFASWQFS